MQVQPIPSCHTNFGAIFVPDNIQFSKEQENVVQNIQTKMRQPNKALKGKTAEQFYEAKGIDFEIIPYDNDSVALTGYRGIRTIGQGEDKYQTYVTSFVVGKYSKYNDFNTSDIDVPLKEEKKRLCALASMVLLPVIGMFAMIFASVGLIQSKQSREFAKPMIEKSDTVLHSIKPVASDTMKSIRFHK